MLNELSSVSELFGIKSPVKNVKPIGNGCINSTVLVIYESGEKYTVQKINHHVFRNVPSLMSNIIKVSRHLGEKYISMGYSPKRYVLDYKRAQSGEYWVRTDKGNYYRMYSFIDNAVSVEKIESDAECHLLESVGIAYGRFGAMLNDFDAGCLEETIKDFHNTPKRFSDFKKAVDDDLFKRKGETEREIEMLMKWEDDTRILSEMARDGGLPLRVVHNDTKLGNVLLDKDTLAPLAVIDLDTVMPGLIAYDFGDCVRSGASTAAEDEKELSLVDFSLERFKMFTLGYMSEYGGLLTSAEKNSLAVGSYVTAIELGMRFLTDYLQNDIYFKTAYPAHNLVRCRTQLKLAGLMRERLDEMNEIIEKCCRK